MKSRKKSLVNWHSEFLLTAAHNVVKHIFFVLLIFQYITFFACIINVQRQKELFRSQLGFDRCILLKPIPVFHHFDLGQLWRLPTSWQFHWQFILKTDTISTILVMTVLTYQQKACISLPLFFNAFQHE